MCGIAGIAGGPGSAGARSESVLRSMIGSVRHRGPDGEGIWVDPQGGAALGHRRLAIIDLTPTGAQPMVSADGRFVVTYNGEIYNFLRLRDSLYRDNVRLVGTSDTEVMVEWIARRGLESFLSEAEGMFAFAVWDRRERRLFLARDRVGIKPLYWLLHDGFLAFASEIKSLHRLPKWQPEIDRDVLAQYLRFGYTPAPRSIFKGVRKLEPGTFLNYLAGREPEIRRYWDPVAVATEGLAATRSLPDREILDLVESEVERSVRQEMISDVPVGCFLSGGIDSSLVTAMMQAAAGRPIKTFSVGFDDPEIDESGYARAVANHLGTDHVEVRVSAEDARNVIPMLPEMYDEPLSDMAQLPTYLVSKLAREHVTVALSGDGGDELFGGYDRYRVAEATWAKLSRVPGPARSAARSFLQGSPGPIVALTAYKLGFASSRQSAQRRIARLAEALDGRSPMEVYRAVSSLWTEAGDIVIGSREPFLPIYDPELARELDPVARFQLVDLCTYLPDAILTKVDRASMAVSLETRVPLLNHKLIELAFRLPASARRRGGMSKWALREVLYRRVPRALVDRPKKGFGVPIGNWLRGPLRAWADERLSDAALRETDLFDPAPIRRRWLDHRAGVADWSYPLWAVLVFQDWHAAWKGAIRSEPRQLLKTG
ncbi:MAG TPA: asparagine synthase (glutamine-hydrolyzing) [Beijerinckiaceae bacterium]|nr:asparagine synthase (glutamine-hydrolyzing) [Beijerinckiaceae bacterium]